MYKSLFYPLFTDICKCICKYRKSTRSPASPQLLQSFSPPPFRGLFRFCSWRSSINFFPLFQPRYFAQILWLLSFLCMQIQVDKGFSLSRAKAAEGLSLMPMMTMIVLPSSASWLQNFHWKRQVSFTFPSIFLDIVTQREAENFLHRANKRFHFAN